MSTLSQVPSVRWIVHDPPPIVTRQVPPDVLRADRPAVMRELGLWEEKIEPRVRVWLIENAASRNQFDAVSVQVVDARLEVEAGVHTEVEQRLAEYSNALAVEGIEIGERSNANAKLSAKHLVRVRFPTDIEERRCRRSAVSRRPYCHLGRPKAAMRTTG